MGFDRDMTGLQLLGVNRPAEEAVRPRPSWVSFFISVAGGLTGYVAWPKHRVLGLLNGSALAANMHAVATGQRDWTDAARRVGHHVVATAGSLALHPHPVVGYVAGAIAANMLIDDEGTGITEEWAHHSGIVDGHPVETVKAVLASDAKPQAKVLKLPAVSALP